jgi:hypothetical protein
MSNHVRNLASFDRPSAFSRTFAPKDRRRVIGLGYVGPLAVALAKVRVVGLIARASASTT